MRRWAPFAAVAAVLLTAALAVPALGASGLLPPGGSGTVYACVSSSHTFTHVSVASPLACPSQQPVSWPVAAGGPSPSPSPTTASPSPTPTTASPSPSPSGGTCVAHIGGGCQYQWAGWPGSNGYNTYVIDQGVGPAPGSTGSVTATSPSSWTASGQYGDCGGCVQTYTAVQQLTNNWGGSGWNCGATCTDTPLSALTSLTISYSETSPSDSGDQYEFSPDIWTSYSGRLCGGCGDVMMWADTSSQRCGAVGGWPVLGHPVIDGQDWTAYLGPGGAGDEIILVLDGAGGPGTCARQSSGALDVLAALQWLSANPGASGFPALSSLTMSSLNIGWEITDAAGGAYAMNGLAFNVTTS